MWKWLDKLFGGTDKLKYPPYRRVVKREPTKDGDNLELECGHHILLQRHQRVTFPCEECQEENRP